MSESKFRWVAIIVAIVIASLFVTTVAFSDGHEPIKEQYPGHIAPQDIHNGISTVDVTVHGEKVSCIYFTQWQNNFGSITCDWNNQR